MSDDPQEQIARRLREAARTFPYPPTPDLVAALRARRSRPRWPTRAPSPVALALLLVAAAAGALLAVPQVRAAALEALRIGAVRIIPAAPAPATVPTPVDVPLPPPTALPTTASAPAAPPAAPASPTPGALAAGRAEADALRGIRGAITLDEARARLPFALRLPAAPPGLGPPDDVFVQELGGPAAILIWRDPDDADSARLALYVLADDVFAQKIDVPAFEETTVGGRRAIWTNGPYVLQLGEGRELMTMRRLVTGHTLIWEEDGLTYRLECDLTLAEAVEVAESLR